MVEGDRQLDDAEARAEMAAGDRHGIDGLDAQLFGDLVQVALGKSAEIAWDRDRIEQRCL